VIESWLKEGMIVSLQPQSQTGAEEPLP
jgi:hypothetical protein